mmetsp:Transcript_29745/g.45987  ORF Transcript_29745/g.45987 Transcript_29745/m.45987 type:complete len:380 (+) Transcript_29745:384-1523(+)
MRSFTFRSSSPYSSASRIMRSISSWLKRPLSFVMVIFSSLLVDLSMAETSMIPFSSTSNVTSIWGTPRGAGGIPLRSNLPSWRLSFVRARSPSYTTMVTLGWLSEAVLKTWLFFAGIWVLRSTSFVMTPPTVSIPRDRGITSTRRTLSLTALSPQRTAPWTAAPYATASSGLIPLLSSFPLKKSLRSCWTLGIRVEPPTRTMSSISLFLSLASARTASTGLRVLLNRSMLNSSNFARLIFSEKSNPSVSPSTSTWASGWEDSCRFAASQALRRRARALWSLEMSTLFFFLISSTKCFIMRLSKSSPPRWVSPFVATTSKKPSSIVSRETSNVPPPRSNTRIFRSPFLSRPYAMAAAVGSLMIRATLSPAIAPASLVDWR